MIVAMPPEIAKLRMLEIMMIENYEDDAELVKELKEVAYIVWNTDKIYTLTYPDGTKLRTFGKTEIAKILGVQPTYLTRLVGMGKILTGRCRGYTVTLGGYE